MKIDFLAHLESFMCKWKFESESFKKNPIQPPNGVLPICKLPFPNESYRNGVCRALWALILAHFQTGVLAIMFIFTSRLLCCNNDMYLPHLRQK